jgi:hypothetical protein
MKPQSAKAKGRNLCKYVKDRILAFFPLLFPDDIKVTSSGAGGEDLQFARIARQTLPVSIECKNRAKIAVYKDYAQAKANAAGYEPVLIVKQNHSTPLAIMDLEYYLKLESIKYVK